MIVLSWAMCFLAFWCIAMSMPRNRKFLLTRINLAIPDSGFKCIGFAALTGALVLACGNEGIAEGIVYWCFQMTVCALMIALTISYNQKRKTRKHNR